MAIATTTWATSPFTQYASHEIKTLLQQSKNEGKQFLTDIIIQHWTILTGLKKKIKKKKKSNKKSIKKSLKHNINYTCTFIWFTSYIHGSLATYFYKLATVTTTTTTTTRKQNKNATQQQQQHQKQNKNPTNKNKFFPTYYLKNRSLRCIPVDSLYPEKGRNLSSV